MKKLLLTAALLSAAFGYSQTFVNTNLLTQPKQSGSDCACAAWINSDLAEAGGSSNDGRAPDGNAVKLENLEARGLYQEIAVTANTNYIITFQYRFSEGGSDVASDPFITLTTQGTVLAGAGYEAGYIPTYQVEGDPTSFNSSNYGYSDIADVENTANQLAFETYTDPGDSDYATATLTFNSGTNTSVALFIRAIRDGANVPFEGYSWSTGDSEVRIDAITLEEDTALSSNDFTIDGETLAAYPVPMTETLTVGGIEVDNTTLYSMGGTVVATGTQSIDVASLASGAYILEVTSNGKSSSTMVVK